VTLTELQNNLYQVFDRVAGGGGPVKVERHGAVVVIQREESPSRLERLQEPPTRAYIGDSDKVIGMLWENEWQRRPN
jgi:prevent-host-death family protein